MAEGFKDFAPGDILTAADVDDYLMRQAVMRFADASARTTALSGVLVEGMMSYLKDTNTVEVYDGSAWVGVGGVDVFAIEYVVIAGGGAGGAGNTNNVAGGGGAGGYVSNVSGENSGGASTANPALYIPLGGAVFVSVGAGGTAVTTGNQFAPNWTCGTSSYFGDVWAVHGGRGGGLDSSGPNWHYAMPSGTSGSNGGGGEQGGPKGGIARQGSDGGNEIANGGGGGGGSGANGSNATLNNGGAGGAGTASSITGSSVTRGGGGGGGGTSSGGAGGSGGGGAGSTGTGNSGTANTGGGGGGGGGSSGTWAGGSGGSGVIILKWLTADATPTIGAGLTTSSATSGDYTVLTITAGTDTITWN